MLLSRPTQETVLGEITSKRERCFDRIVQSNELYAAVVEEKRMEYCRDFEGILSNKYGFSRSAFTQLLNRRRVPIAFFDRCSRELKRDIFNHFISSASVSYLFRMENKNMFQVPLQGIEEEHVRACLTDSYGIVDDIRVFPVVFDVLKNMENWHIHQFVSDAQITSMLIHFDDAIVDYNNMQHIAGLQITNSETGHSSVWIEPVVSIPGCSFASRNTLRAQLADIRIVHRGEVDEARVRQMVSGAKEIAQVGVVQVMEAWEDKVDKAHALRFAKGIDSLPKRMYDILEEEWTNDLEVAKAVVAQRIIALASEMPLFQRIQTEQSACKIIGLFDNYKARMAAILDEIE